MILMSGLLALSACEKEENFSSPEVQLTAEKLILCPGDEVIIKISSSDTIVDLSLVSLQLLNPSVGELNNFTYSAPSDLSEDEQILIQATYNGQLLDDSRLLLEIDGSNQETFVRKYELYDIRTFHSMDLHSLPDGKLLAASGERETGQLFRMAKLDTDGSILWVRGFGEGSCEEVLIQQNTIIAGGVSYDGLERTLVVYEIDLEGNLLNTLQLGEAYALLDMEIYPEGDLLLAIAPQEASQQTQLIKVDKSGNVLWEKRLDQALVRDLLITDDEEIAMSYVTADKAILSLLSSAGTHRWDRELGTEQAYLPLALADDGSIVAAVHAVSNNRRFFGLQKYDTQGQPLFAYSFFPSPSADEYLIFDMKKVSDGYLISGMSIKDGTDRQYLRKADVEGNPVWDWSYGNEQTQGFAHTIAALEDDIFVWGGIEDRSENALSLFNTLIRLDGDGTLSPCQQEGF